MANKNHIRNSVYMVMARKWGSEQSHNYPVGVFEDKIKAVDAADIHYEYRGKKYTCYVYRCTPNKLDNDNAPVEIYATN